MAVFVQTVSDAKQSLAQLQEQLTNTLQSSRKTALIRAGEVRDASIIGVTRPALRLIRAFPIKTLVKPVDRTLSGALKSAIEPLENYDDLTAKAIVSELKTADAYTVRKVEKYETANKNRVTVLRAI